MRKPSLKSTLICKVETCDRPYLSKDYCKAHYNQFKKYGKIIRVEILVKKSGCSVTDCTRKHHGKGYCEIHTWQLKNHSHICDEHDKSLHYKEGSPKGWQKNTGRTHFAKNVTPWNKDTKGLMVAWNKGISKYQYIEKESNKTQRIAFRKIRNLVVARDNSICQVCDTATEYPQVDHIKSWSKYPELRFELSNCRTLCMACHYYITYKRKLPEGIFWGHRSQTT